MWRRNRDAYASRSPVECWSDPLNSQHPSSWTYADSRQRFRDAATVAGWEVEEHAIDALGPGGERLTIDVAISPNEGYRRTVIVSSGLHGVEGAFGAAVQRECLADWPLMEAFPDVRFVFVHALNPFGFAWSRRVNEENVDLNRNFLLEGQEYRGSPDAYRKLDPLLNPQRPPQRLDGFYLQAGLAVLRDGMPALKQAVAGGQYDFPQGLFFGGHGPSQTQRILREQLRRWAGDSRAVTHLDFHTGLGRWGTYKLLLDDEMPPERRERMRRTFGDDAVQPARSDGVAYSARGSLGPWCASLLGGVDYVYACAEFGTYPALRVLAGLRAENQATHWANANSVITMESRRRLRALFCPPHGSWWERLLPPAIGLVQAAAETDDAK